MADVSGEGLNSWETSGCGPASTTHPFFIPESVTEVKGDTEIAAENICKLFSALGDGSSCALSPVKDQLSLAFCV